MTETMNIQTLPKISKELANAVSDFLVAKAHVETIKPIIDAIDQKWIDDNQPQPAEEYGSRVEIKKPFDAYLMEQEVWDVYYAETSATKREKGFFFDEGSCPLSVAEHDLIKTKWRILEYTSCITGVSSLNVASLEKRDKIIDMAVALVVKAPKELFA